MTLDEGDFVSPKTLYWIGASKQMMLNIIDLTHDGSRASQERYMRVARSMGPSLRQSDQGHSAGGLRAAGSSAWGRSFVDSGAGSQAERALDGYGSAVRDAAHALRRTNRPVGPIVWRGVHAWVMTGFTATADALANPDHGVTAVFGPDPWSRRVLDPGPGQNRHLDLIKALKADFHGCSSPPTSHGQSQQWLIADSARHPKLLSERPGRPEYGDLALGTNRHTFGGETWTPSRRLANAG